MKQNSGGATLSLRRSISGIGGKKKYSFFIFHCLPIANEVTVFFECSIAPWVAFFSYFFFPSSGGDVSPIKTDQPRRERDTRTRHHSHYLHSLLSRVWQHNYQSRGPVQLKASGLLTARVLRGGNAVEDEATKGVLRVEMSRCSDGSAGSAWTTVKRKQ